MSEILNGIQALVDAGDVAGVKQAATRDAGIPRRTRFQLLAETHLHAYEHHMRHMDDTAFAPLQALDVPTGVDPSTVVPAEAPMSQREAGWSIVRDGFQGMLHLFPAMGDLAAGGMLELGHMIGEAVATRRGIQKPPQLPGK